MAADNASAYDAVKAALDSLGLPYECPEPGAYLRALRGLLVYEATGRADFSAGVAFCRRLLEH